jgi:hypothetical protein
MLRMRERTGGGKLRVKARNYVANFHKKPLTSADQTRIAREAHRRSRVCCALLLRRKGAKTQERRKLNTSCDSGEFRSREARDKR